MNRIKFY